MNHSSKLSKLSMFVVGLASICAHTTMALPNTDSKPTKDEHSFDYVVVGGGTAGLALASRLVEESSSTVAVIEAGGYYEKDNGNISTTPAFWIYSVGTDPDDVNPAVDWGFVTQPEKGVLNRKIHYPRGKTLGGSSARNVMYYHRITEGAAQKWADTVGDDSYTFKNLLPYYKKSVEYHPPSLPYPDNTNNQDNSAFTPKGGPLQLSFGKYVDPFGTLAAKALQKVGLKALAGLSSGKLIGSAYVAFTVDAEKSQRSSSESSYLQQALKTTSTLTVYHNSLAEKILFEKKRAVGVLVTSDGKEIKLHAKKEVILSAGAIQSPQLLMVSGVGPKETLKQHNIPVVHELPGIGQNLADHFLFSTSYPVNIPTFSAALNDPKIFASLVDLYNTQQAGPLSIPSTGITGWEKLPEPYRNQLSTTSRSALDKNVPADWPELEHIFTSAVLGYNRNYLHEDPVDGQNYASVVTAMNAPLSKGTISISSSKMSDPPLIDFGWLTNPTDREIAIGAFHRNREIWAALKETTTGPEKVPGPEYQSDEQILEFVQKGLAPVWHASATCKMGRKGDKYAVVNNRAKVFGLRGLRVVDASAFPFLLPGHPQATVYAFAEKIAEDILKGKGKEEEEEGVAS